MTDEHTEIEELITFVDTASEQQTLGEWLEVATDRACELIREWDIERSWPWDEWPERGERFPGTTKRDIGVDVVAVRRSDGEHIAIQCKARQLDERGEGGPISKSEVDSFASTSAGSFWAERWIVTNGSVSMGGNTVQLLEMHDKPIKQVNIAHDLREQLQSETFESEGCPHCVPPPIFPVPSNRPSLACSARLSPKASESCESMSSPTAVVYRSARRAGRSSCHVVPGRLALVFALSRS